MDMDESEQKIKQEWSLLDPMVDIFAKIEEGLDFTEADNILIRGGKVVNIAYQLIFRIGGTEKEYEQWEDIQVGLKTCQVSKDHFSQACMHYQICKK